MEIGDKKKEHIFLRTKMTRVQRSRSPVLGSDRISKRPHDNNAQ